MIKEDLVNLGNISDIVSVLPNLFSNDFGKIIAFMAVVGWYVENNFLKVWHMSYFKFRKAFGDGKITIVDA